MNRSIVIAASGILSALAVYLMQQSAQPPAPTAQAIAAPTNIKTLCHEMIELSQEVHSLDEGKRQLLLMQGTQPVDACLLLERSQTQDMCYMLKAQGVVFE